MLNITKRNKGDIIYHMGYNIIYHIIKYIFTATKLVIWNVNDKMALIIQASTANVL